MSSNSQDISNAYSNYVSQNNVTYFPVSGNNSQDLTNNQTIYVLANATTYFPVSGNNLQDITTEDSWYVVPTNTTYFPVSGNNSQDLTSENIVYVTTTNETYFPTIDDNGQDITDEFTIYVKRPDTLSPIQLTVAYDGTTQFEFKFKLPSTSSIDIYDGDGTMTTIVGQDTTLITHTTAYSDAGSYTFYIDGYYTDITYIRMSSISFVSGSVSRWGELLSLTSIILIDLNISGSVDTWGDLALSFINIKNIPLLEGNLSLIGIADSMTYYIVNVCPLVTWSGVKTNLSTCIVFSLEHLKSLTNIDEILESVNVLVSSSITIVSDVSKRTVNSDDDLLTLLNNDNTIVLDEDSSVGTLGPELNTGVDAISPDEADSIGSWVAYGGIITGNNTFESQSIEKYAGDYAFRIEVTDTPVAGGTGAISDFTVEDGFYQRIVFAGKYIDSGGIWVCNVDDIILGWNGWNETSEGWVPLVVYKKATSDSMTLTLQETSTTNDGGIYFDNLSIKKLTLS